MSDSTEEASYYLRFISFFIDVATDTALQVVNYCTNKDIEGHLTSSGTRQKLSQLLNDKFLTKPQYNLVRAQVPNPNNFDLGLLITLLCSTGLLPEPNQGWKNRPGPVDLSLSADILRLRYIRNGVVAHKPRAALYESKFERLWKDLEKILLRINAEIAPGTEDILIDKIENYRSRKLDAHNEQKYLQKLEEWWENCEDISKLQEKVEELVQKCNEFALFFKDKPEKYSRYVRLLFECGKLVLSNVIQKQILEQGHDLCTKLLENRKVFKNCMNSQEMFDHLFPTDSTDTVHVNTDTDSWDILVLAHVIETILKPTNMKVINIIKHARINYADTALMSLHEGEHFSSCCEDLVYSIRMLSASLDEDIQNKCEEHIDKYRNKSADPTTDSDDYLCQLKTHGLGIKKLSDLYQETLVRLKKSVQEMENNGISFQNYKVLELKMVTLGESSQKKKIAEDTLETVWQAALRRSENPEEFEDVRLEVDKILEEIRNVSDVEVTEIKRYCLLISLTCCSYKGLVKIIDYLISESFEQHIVNLSRELGYLYDDTIKIEGHMTFESLHKILEKPQGCTAGDDRGLSLPIICSSPEGMREVLELLGKEKTTNIINEIADSLSVQVDETISLNLFPDLKGFTGVFDETDSETTSSSDSHIDETEYLDRYLPTQILLETYPQNIHDEDDAPEPEDLVEILERESYPEVETVPENRILNLSDEESKLEFQTDLIALYRKKHTTIPIDFITDDIDLPLDRLYVSPYPLYSIDTCQKIFKPLLHTKEVEIRSLHGVFFNEGVACRDIYLTAETGMGKTAFVKWLALSWCNAHDCKEHLAHTSEENDEMTKYKFLFLVSAGETNNDEYHVDNIIYDNIICQFEKSVKYDRKDVERLLETEDCLIILDGIDESITYCKTIPARSERERNTFLTTCTPWTFKRLGLTSTQIDKHVIIRKLRDTCLEDLSKNMITLFTDKTSGIVADSFSVAFSERLFQSKESACEQFKDMLQEKKIDHLIRSPVILSHVLSLWIFEDSGKSLCDVYSEMISFLVTRASQKKAFDHQLSKFKTQDYKTTDGRNASIPSYDKLYLNLGLLAFHTLFSEEKEHHYEFDETEARRILISDAVTEPSDIIEAGFITGILSSRRLSRKKYSISFFHPKVHQYFAALYFKSLTPSDISEQLTFMFTTVPSVLEVADMLIFLSGFNPELARNIVQQIQPEKDYIEKHGFTCSIAYLDQIKNIQDMIVGCVEESRNSAYGRMDLQLQDVVVDPSCENSSYKTHLKRLVKTNLNNIQSLHVEESLPRELRAEMLLFLEQLEFPKLQKLRMVGVSVLENCPWIQDYKTLRCVHLEQMFFKSESISWEILLGIIQQPFLEALGLESILITHKELDEMVRHITDSINLTKVVLREIKCDSHGDSCSGVVMDLSSHEKLHQLELVNVPVTEVQLNVNSLDECLIGNLPGRSSSEILTSLQDSACLSRFICCGLSSLKDITMLMHVLPDLETLVYIDLSFMDFDQNTLHLPPLLQNLKLLYVSMSGIALQEITETVETYPQSMTVDLMMCSVEPKGKFKNIKQYIGSSSNFIITNDVLERGCVNFTFKTIPSNKRK